MPRSPAARRARRILVVGQEQDSGGFNTALACCNQYWARVQAVPVVRGAFNVDNRLRHIKDLVSSAKATSTTLSFTIRKNAYWNWGGRKLPVTYADFAYTWQQMVNPANAVVSRAGYDQITGFTHRGDRQITFTWQQPYGDWQDLFDVVYPSAALAGQDFNRVWVGCICGNDGKPVSDGPFMLTSYTAGEGSSLQPNPFWYGKTPGLKEIDFKVVADVFSEVHAMRAGQVDVINPTFGVSLLPLKNVHGLTYDQVPSLSQEHIDIQFGPQGQQLLRAPWMRQAIMMGINRSVIISTVFGGLAGGIKPLDSIVFYQRDSAYKPTFAKWDYNPRKALNVLKRHCTDGPRTPSAGNAEIFTCSGIRASFRFTWSSADVNRTTQEALVKSELKSIGIEIVDAPLSSGVIFGPSGIPSGNYDLADFAWRTAADPSSFAPIWGCSGASNFLGYCDRSLTNLFDEAAGEVSPAARIALYHRADARLSRYVPSIPLYSRPDPLVWRSAIVGMKNNPSARGFAWNAETWRWRR